MASEIIYHLSDHDVEQIIIEKQRGVTWEEMAHSRGWNPSTLKQRFHKETNGLYRKKRSRKANESGLYKSVEERLEFAEANWRPALFAINATTRFMEGAK